jgi:hypothetical protein
MFEGLETALDAYLQELTDCIDFVSVSSALRPRLGAYIAWDAGDLPKQLITDFLGSKSVREQVIYRAIYVSGHAAFEQFSRDLVSDAADQISATIGSYDNLWGDIKTEHLYRTGQAMVTIRKPLEHLPFDYHQLSTNIGSCVPGGSKLRLNATALALVHGPLTPDNLESLITRLSIPFSWDSLASHQPLKACFRATDARESANEAKAFLDQMVKNRNRIAHSTGTAAEIDEAELREQVRFVGAFCHALSALVKRELNKKLTQLARRR